MKIVLPVIATAVVVLLAIPLLETAGTSGSEMHFRKPAPKDKCPVCGMFVAKYPDWVAELTFKDGSYVVFDGPKDMFKYYLEPEKYGRARKKSDIAAVFVTDYYDLRVTNGYNAYYVMGSDVYGPMGRELVPFEKHTGAAEFLKDHKGEKILTFEKVTSEVLKGLD